MYIHMYTYIYIYVYIHICIYAYVYAYIHVVNIVRQIVLLSLNVDGNSCSCEVLTILVEAPVKSWAGIMA